MNNTVELWNATWTPEIHQTEDAQKRIKSAQSSKLTPIKIDKNDMYGYFQGSHGKYETWLNTCPCGDFRRSKLPCKHIYRLAMELGVLNVEFDADPNMIPVSRSEQVPLSDMVDLIESLPESSQQRLLRLAISTTADAPVKQTKIDEDIEKLLDSGIITEISRTSKMIKVQIPGKYNRRNIHYYLHRKYDTEEYYDPSVDDYVTVSVLDTQLPDDAVTAELIKRGYYKGV